jgi:hypothetical protein
MKFLLISKKFTYVKRGAFLTSERLSKHFPEHLDYLEEIQAQNLEHLSTQYKRLIFVTQAMKMYSLNLPFTRLKKLNALVYIRSGGGNFPVLYESCNNGFHYYKTYPNIKFFVPFVTDFHVQRTKKFDIPCVGFYIRRNLVHDSVMYMHNFLKSFKGKLDVFIMGEPAPEILRYPSVRSYGHTYDNTEFFKEISHYVYPQSATFQDPFPNSVLEAVQNGIQIVLPEIPGRTHKDGIDDIKDCIQYHETFNPDIEHDNSNIILQNKYFKNWYHKVFDNNFEYSFDRNKYHRFNEWIEHQVI